MTLLAARAVPRRVANLAGAVLFSAGAFFASSYVQRDAGPMVGVVTLAACLSFAFWPESQRVGGIRSAMREVLSFAALAALGLLLATYLFAHLSTDRYLWVISQDGMCAHLGSAAIAFTMTVVTVMLSVGAAGLLLSQRTAPIPWRGTLAGAAVGAAAVILGAAMPATAAQLLGCL